MIRKIGIVLVLLLVAQVLQAQQAAVNDNAPAATKIYLKSGKVVEGDIVSYDAVSVVIKDPSLGLMTIPRENILRIDPPLEEKKEPVAPPVVVQAQNEFTKAFQAGKKLYDDGEYKEAALKFRQALTLANEKGEIVETYFYLSLSYYGLGESDNAQLYLNKMFEVQPEREINERLFPSGYIILFYRTKSELAKPQPAKLEEKPKEEAKAEEKKAELEKKAKEEEKKEPVAPPVVVQAPFIAPPAATTENTLSMAVVRFGYFLASDSAFKPIYGNGPVFGGELRLGGRQITGWLEGNYRARTGASSIMKEETKVNVLAIEGGALYKIMSGKIMPYVGAGLGYYMYAETSEAFGEAKKSNIGFCVLGGASMRVLKGLVLDGRIKYSTSSMQPADFKVNVGGLTFGLGLGLGF